MQQHFQIAGHGHAFPKNQVTAQEIERRTGMPAGWVMQHTGVELRYECGRDESVSTLAVAAANAALQSAGLTWKNIDAIIDCSTCLQQPIPCNAAMLQSVFGAEAHGIPCFDVHSTCLGFLLSLNVVNGLLASGAIQCAMIVASESLLAGVHWGEPESAALMGDGAAAIIVQRRETPVECFLMHQTFSDDLAACQVKGGGHRMPVFDYSPERESDYRFTMDGPKIFRLALKRLPGLVDSLVQQSGIPRDELHVVPHQAAPGAIEAVRRLCKFTTTRFENRASRIGNTAAASIPIVLSMLLDEQGVAPGAPLMLLGTSAGYSQAGLIFRL